MERIDQNRLNGAVGILTDNSVRPVMHPEKIEETVEKSIKNGLPLCLRMVLCPNWVVNQNGRSIGEIPVHTEGNQLIIENPDTKIAKFLSEELPNTIDGLISHDINTKVLVILADILSSNWVHDAKGAKIKLDQNRKAIQLLLLSSPHGKEVFNKKERAQVKVASQLQLATNTHGYEDRLNAYQSNALLVGTKMHVWYMETIRRLQEMGEYSDIRPDVAGRRKIWERALFLASIYALDGEVIEGDLKRTGLSSDKKPNCIAIGTVKTAHGDIIAKGWNLNRKDKIGVTSPFKNSMEHSWSEKSY